MKSKYSQIEEKLNLFETEFSNIKPKVPKERKVKVQPMKDQKDQENSFEAVIKNVDKTLAKSARKWKDNEKGRGKKSSNELSKVLAIMDSLESGHFISKSSADDKISPPSKPIGPYMLFHIQKSSQLKHKKLLAVAQLKSTQKTIDSDLFKQKISDSVAIYQQWNAMTMEEKDSYYLQYENRLWKYNFLNDEFRILTNQKKILKPYNRFYKKMNGILEVEGKYSIAQITQIIKQKWAVITEEQKKQYELQYEQEMQEMDEIQKNKSQRVATYREKLIQYEKQQELQKMEILSKYNLMPKELNQISKLAENEKVLRNFEKKQERARKKERYQKLKKETMEKNYKRLLQMKEKQIMELKLQNYELEGLPRDIFTSTPLKIGQKVSISSTTLSGSKKQSEYSDEDSNENGSAMQRKTKQIKKQTEQREKPPGMSTFRKLLMEIKKPEEMAE